MVMMFGIILAFIVCIGTGFLCAYANRVMFLVTDKNERQFPCLGIVTLFISLFVNIFFMVLADYQYSKFMSWILQRFVLPAIYLVLFKTFFITSFTFLSVMLLNFFLYKKVKWFNTVKMRKYELLLTVTIYTLSYGISGEYLFKPLVRYLVRTYIKY